jgi:hypothetical protein
MPVMLASHGLSAVLMYFAAVTVSVCMPAGKRDFIMAEACSTDIPRWMPSMYGSFDKSICTTGATGACAETQQGDTSAAAIRTNP